MAHIKSVREALIEKLSDTMDPDNAAEFVAEFEQACGLVPGAVYMAVPRCDQCRWWERGESDRMDTWGRCQRISVSARQPENIGALAVTTTYDDGDGDLSTNESFGCVQFEAKGGE